MIALSIQPPLVCVALLSCLSIVKECDLPAVQCAGDEIWKHVRDSVSQCVA